MTSLSRKFQTDLPLPEGLAACAEAIHGLGWHIAAVEGKRIVSYPGLGAERSPKIEVGLEGLAEETVIRITGNDTAEHPLSEADLIPYLDRVRDSIQTSIEQAADLGEPDWLEYEVAEGWGGEGVPPKRSRSVKQKAGSAVGLLGALFGFVVVLSQLILWGGTSLGVVHEYCLDNNASAASGTVKVDTKWTYILWPPLFLDALDPPGRCVRNTPLREGLDSLGIWKLPSPEEQVRQHVLDQVRGQ